MSPFVSAVLVAFSAAIATAVLSDGEPSFLEDAGSEFDESATDCPLASMFFLLSSPSIFASAFIMVRSCGSSSVPEFDVP